MRTTITALEASAIGLSLALSGAASGAADEFSESVQETYIVPTRHGNLYVEVVRPADVVVPAIPTLSSYSVLGRNSDADRWWTRGYARVWADVVGTGNSGGCYDYGGSPRK